MPYLKKTLLLFIRLFICHIATAQANLPTADSLYDMGRYKQACDAYFNDFKLNPQDTADSQTLYHAAQACVKVKYDDSSFAYLSRIANARAFKYFDDILYGETFKSIWKDKRWDNLSAKMEKYKHDFNAPVSVEFTELGRQRLAVESGKDSVLIKDRRNFRLIRKFTDSIQTLDSINNLKFKTIIHTYGWIGPKNVGNEGFRWLIYLYKRLPITTQKTYFSFIVNDFKQHQLAAADYAVISDRISLYDTGKQIYGTQTGKPIENSGEVNVRRQSIGLDELYEVGH